MSEASESDVSLPSLKLITPAVGMMTAVGGLYLFSFERLPDATILGIVAVVASSAEERNTATHIQYI